MLVDGDHRINKRVHSLLSAAKHVFDSIIKTPIPDSICQLCKTISRVLKENKIPLPPIAVSKGGDPYDSFTVSNTFFLHFLCPFLVTLPEDLAGELN